MLVIPDRFHSFWSSLLCYILFVFKDGLVEFLMESASDLSQKIFVNSFQNMEFLRCRLSKNHFLFIIDFIFFFHISDFFISYAMQQEQKT